DLRGNGARRKESVLPSGASGRRTTRASAGAEGTLNTRQGLCRANGTSKGGDHRRRGFHRESHGRRPGGPVRGRRGRSPEGGEAREPRGRNEGRRRPPEDGHPPS